MILTDLTIPYSSARIDSDLKQIEYLGKMISNLAIPIDFAMKETFQKLQELAGSRDFSHVHATLFHFVSKLKWAREGMWETGYVVPWMSVYSHLGSSNSKLAAIAVHHYSAKDELFKTSSLPNSFGSLVRPVEPVRDDWTLLLQTTIKQSIGNVEKAILRIKRASRPVLHNSPMKLSSAASLDLMRLQDPVKFQQMTLQHQQQRLLEQSVSTPTTSSRYQSEYPQAVPLVPIITLTAEPTPPPKSTKKKPEKKDRKDKVKKASSYVRKKKAPSLTVIFVEPVDVLAAPQAAPAAELQINV